MHRVDGRCHWCGELTSAWRRSNDVLRRAVAVAVMLLGAGAVWRVGPSVRDFANTLMMEAQTDWQRDPGIRAAVAASGDLASPIPLSPASATTRSAPVLDSAGAIMSIAAGDSITWTPAVARTWVNVRSDASRGGQVVGVIKPTTRAMLGTDRAGWRQVRSTDVSGWVDPRLFEADSLRTRGE